MAVRDIVQAAAGVGGGGLVEPIGVDFDGSTDSLARTSDLIGNTDSKTFTFSAWFYRIEGSMYMYSAFTGSQSNVDLYVESNGAIYGSLRNPSNTVILAFNTSGSSAIRTFYHVLISIDLTSTSRRSVYLNDVLLSTTWTTYTNSDINWTSAYHCIAGDTGAINGNITEYKSRLAGVYLDYTYRDLSIEANRRLFIGEDRLYVTPPTTGIISVPMDDPTNPGRNDGTGGDFTLNGVVARSGRGPNQYNAPYSDLDGSSDYLSKTSITMTDSKQFTLSFFFFHDSGTGWIIGSDTDTSPQSIFLYVAGTNLNFVFKSSSGTTGIDVANIPIRPSSNNHFLMTCDVTDGGSVSSNVLINSTKTKIFVNGVDVTSSCYWQTYNNVAMGFASQVVLIGTRYDLSNKFNGRLGNVFFDTKHIDLSNANNLAKFVSGTGNEAKPTNLGVNGELPFGTAPLIFLPMEGTNAGKNYGTGGDFTVNSGPYPGARGPNEYWANAAEFNGTNQNLERGVLTGIANGKQFTIVCAIRHDSSSGAGAQRILSFQDAGTANRLYLADNGNNFNLIGSNINATTSGGFGPQSTWQTVLISIDLSDTGKRHVYFNGSSASVTWNTYTNSDVDFVSSDVVAVGADADNNGGYWDGKIGFLWFNTEYIDFSQEANRLKFFDAFNNPVDLGADGSVPTGSQPLIYMNEGFHLGTNLGSGGNFTPQNTPTDGGCVNG